MLGQILKGKMMIRLASPIAAFFWAGALWAQEPVLPSLFDVTGVAPDDVLNVRAAPDGSADILSGLSFDAKRIEIVELREGWGRVNVGEGSGWISMRYVVADEATWQAGTLPGTLSCFGTEPFWTLKPGPDGLGLTTPEMQGDPQPVTAVLDRGIAQDATRAIVTDGTTLVVTPQICSDGMSDRVFGLRATAILSGAQPQLLSGCCSVQP